MKSLSSSSVLKFSSLTIIFALVVPSLFMDGMFADGTLYAAVAKNFAVGTGNPWTLHFSKTIHDHFHEQPPLFFVLESFFFRLFNNSIYSERFFCLLMAIFNSILISRIWKRIFSGNDDYANQNWLPVFIFFISPVTMWAFGNNVIEIAMSVFVLASGDALIAALVQKKKISLNIFLATIWLIAASLCKGFQGLFPIALPVIFWLSGINISFKKAFGISIALFFFTAVFYGLLSLSPEVHAFYSDWFSSRIVSTFSGTNNTSGSHFFLLFELLLDLLPAIGITIFILLISRNKKYFFKTTPENFTWIKVMLLFALCGSIPLLVTKEQRGFYLLTSLPYYSFVFALFLAPHIVSFAKRLNEKKKTLKIIYIANFILLVPILFSTFYFAGTPKRDGDILNDIRLTGEIIGTDKVITIDPELFNNWGVTNYYGRFYNISVTTNTDYPGSDFYVSKDESGLKNYTRIPLQTKTFSLWEKNVQR